MFDQSSPIPCGEVDEDTMKRIFQQRGFIVDARRDLTKSQMLEVLEEYQNIEHTGCFVVIILSHGRDGVALSSDDQEIHIADIETEFHKSKCPSLQGKPRMFIIDACRGQEDSKEFISTTQTSTHHTKKPFTSSLIFNQSGQNEDPEMDDTAIMYAFSSNLDKKKGSLFAQLFEEVMCEGIERDMQFNTIMTEVQY